MFKFIKERVIKDWPAEIKVALNGGKSTSHAITVDLNILSSSEYRELAGQGDQVVFDKILKGWSGIHDENGNPLPFTDANRDALTELPAFTQAVVRAYMQASSGEASRKN